MKKKPEILILGLLVLILFVLNYQWLDTRVVQFLDSDLKEVNVTRVIDGDTVELDNGDRVRLFGINTPERGELYYSEAKIFLQELVENETLVMDNRGIDRYNRVLGVLFYNGENINQKIIAKGYGNPYFLRDKKYEQLFRESWGECIYNEINICGISTEPCSQCIELEKVDISSQEIVLKNVCDFKCDLSDWSIKDEGRKKYVFGKVVIEPYGKIRIIVAKGTNREGVLFWEGETYVWTNTGDTVFLRDSSKKLVLYDYFEGVSSQ